jgi:hypothetical protein
MRTHGHGRGQGYVYINILMPELLEQMRERRSFKTHLDAAVSVGPAFEVRRADSGTFVAVQDGRVRVDESGAARMQRWPRMSAGGGVAVSRSCGEKR